MKRAVEFVRRFRERMTEEVVPAPHGRALLTPSMPRVHYTNTFAVDLGAEGSATELRGDLEPIFWAAGLTHRQVSIDDELGARAAPEFRELGWKAEELLVMLHRGETPRWTRRASRRSAGRSSSPSGRRACARARRFGTKRKCDSLSRPSTAGGSPSTSGTSPPAPTGRIASYCELFSDGTTGQIESVMTLEEFRRRGLAKAIVTHALAESRAAGHDFTFLLAEAEDWPKELYRKLGFESVGSIWAFLLQKA